MVPPCKPPQTNTDKIWLYDEYYIGERDNEQRKNGIGSNFWSGAESLECYTGQMFCDTMHGDGEYRFRHREDTNLAATYEGYFYNNCLHGYGLMSYPNGRVFCGIYHSNLRWGPGVETFTNLTENVGLWEGTQLVRLTWKPEAPSVIPDLLSTSSGRHVADQNRTVLVACTKTIGETNPALELLKQYGADPLLAEKRWRDLYPKNCTDKKSWFYHGEVFERAYYHNCIETLEEYSSEPDKGSNKTSSKNSEVDHKASQGHVSLPPKYYAWNNNKIVLHMMKHCYQHEKQRSEVKLPEILRGPRYCFKPPAQHELDCRTLLMACYLGHIKNVAQLINEYDVSPNVTDMQGNTPIMYAACGNHTEIIRFLSEAGGRINDYNDACCTALGIVLIQYACAQLNIPPSSVIQAILPPGIPPAPPASEEIISEWFIERDLFKINGFTKKDSEPTGHKAAKPIALSVKKNKSVTSIKVHNKDETQNEPDSNEIAPGEKKLYFMLNNEYFAKVCDITKPPDDKTVVPYIFEVGDMVLEINTTKDELKKSEAKKDVKKASSKNLKGHKISREMMPPSLENFNVKDETKTLQLTQIMSTIKQLLSVGADPRLVRCPQPALLIATVSYSPEVVRLLIDHGADVNEVYPQILGYTPLDVAIAGPMTKGNLEVIRTLLEKGAHADHRLLTIGHPDEPAIPGPTLLHAVIAKKCNEDDEDIRCDMLEVLLDYGCNPTLLYRGQTAIDVVMSKQLVPIFDIIIESPYTDLNGVINESNHTILVKMFFMPYCRTIPVGDRLQMLTNLLLFGADPLLQCRNGNNVYVNLFEYAKEVLSDSDKPLASGPKDTKLPKQPSKQKLKPVKEAAKSIYKSMASVSDDINDYKQCLSLVNDCARLLFIRWLQSKLMKELIVVVKKYKHRHWNMIIKEYENKALGIWLYPVRCLEIWDVLKTTKKRIFDDERVLKYVLYMVHYYNKIYEGNLKQQITLLDKSTIESEVAYFMHEHKITMVTQSSKRPYVMPELTPSSEIKKFNICFECALPLTETNMRCNKCQLIFFCGLECMKTNIDRTNCHPCSNFLKEKYFKSPSNCGTLSEQT